MGVQIFVECFEVGELGGILADFFGEFEEDSAAILRGRLGPRAGVEGGTSGFDGDVDIRGIGDSDSSDDVFGGGVVDGEGFSGGVG